MTVMAEDAPDAAARRRRPAAREPSDVVLAKSEKESAPSQVFLVVFMLLCLGVFCSAAPQLVGNASAQGLRICALAFFLTFIVTGAVLEFADRRRARKVHTSPAAFEVQQPVEKEEVLGPMEKIAEREAYSGARRIGDDSLREIPLDIPECPDCFGPKRESDVQACNIGSFIDEHSREDPLWAIDWSNLKPPQEKVITPSVEVFVLGETPAWLVCLQQRRDRAQCAGNVDAVRRIDHQISEACAVAHIAPPSSVAIPQNLTKLPSPEHRIVSEPMGCASEDVWNLDWTSISAQRFAVLA
jgi:hypothetical protein